jgi:hypothetical protein
VQPAPWWLRNKWRTLTLFWLAQGTLIYALAAPFTFDFGSTIPGKAATLLAPIAFTAVFTALQALFVLPIRRPTLSPRSAPLYVSMAIAGLLIAILVAAGALAVAQVANIEDDAFEHLEPYWVLATVGLSWAVATPLLMAFAAKGPRDAMIRRLSARIFIGTVIEAAAIIPLDVLVRRRNDCMCAAGTYIALIVCAAVGLFVLGPAVFLPLIARHRRRWHAGRCEVCTYDMSGTKNADRCPECGAGWRAGRTTPPSSST